MCGIVTSRLCISLRNIAKLLDFIVTLLIESANMLTPVTSPMLVYYYSAFASLCDSVIVNDVCLSTVGNDGFEFSLGENTILIKI